MSGIKQSKFSQISSVDDDHQFDVFKPGSNRRIRKDDLFRQIREETSTFIYPTEADLRAANLEADQDNPVYVRCEETGYRLYKITSQAAGGDDIELDNGTTATYQIETRDSGFVRAPAESTDGALALFDGDTGELLKEGPLTTEFATAAQGGKADSAVQPSDIEDVVTGPETATADYIALFADSTGKRVKQGPAVDDLATDEELDLVSQSVTGVSDRVTTIEDTNVLETYTATVGLSQIGTLDLSAYEYARFPYQDADGDGIVYMKKDNLATSDYYEDIAGNRWLVDKVYVNAADVDWSGLGTTVEQVASTVRVSPSNNLVFDLHRVAQKSQGAIAGQPLSELSYVTVSGAVAGSTSLSIGANSFISGQLIGYVGSDGEYYTARVKTSGSTLTLHDPLEQDVEIGGEVFNFYKDKSHPSIAGYRAIADYMLRQKTFTQIHRNIDGLILNKRLGPETIGLLSTDSFDNCGSSAYPATRIQTTGAGEGFLSLSLVDVSGDFVVELHINTNGAAMRFRVAETDDIAQFIYDETITTELPTLVRIPLRKKVNSSLVLRMEQTSSAAADVNFIMKLATSAVTNVMSLDGGVHVLHGDSWFDQEGVFERLQARLPNATIINNGVGGRTSANLGQTIDSEVSQYNPNFVWLLAGTNDGILGVLSSGYYRWMNQAVALIKNIGAVPICFTPPAGNLIDGWLGRSREYLYVQDFRDTEIQDYEILTLPFSGVEVAAGSREFCAMTGVTSTDVTVVEAFASGVNNILFGYSTGASAPTMDEVSRAGNTILRAVAVPKSSTDANFFVVGAENTTAAGPQFANGFARVRIKQSVTG